MCLTARRCLAAFDARGNTGFAGGLGAVIPVLRAGVNRTFRTQEKRRLVRWPGLFSPQR
jgi:hypothetical protein